MARALLIIDNLYQDFWSQLQQRRVLLAELDLEQLAEDLFDFDLAGDNNFLDIWFKLKFIWASIL